VSATSYSGFESDKTRYNRSGWTAEVALITEASIHAGGLSECRQLPDDRNQAPLRLMRDQRTVIALTGQPAAPTVFARHLRYAISSILMKKKIFVPLGRMGRPAK
jgi:hypothetical protein